MRRVNYRKTIGIIISIVPFFCENLNEPAHDKTNKMTALSEDSDKPGHPPSLIRVFAVRMKKPWVLNYPLMAQWRLWSDCVDAQADLSLRWGHMPFCWFCHAAAQITAALGLKIITVKSHRFRSSLNRVYWVLAIPLASWGHITLW